MGTQERTPQAVMDTPEAVMEAALLLADTPVGTPVVTRAVTRAVTPVGTLAATSVATHLDTVASVVRRSLRQGQATLLTPCMVPQDGVHSRGTVVACPGCSQPSRHQWRLLRTVSRPMPHRRRIRHLRTQGQVPLRCRAADSEVTRLPVQWLLRGSRQTASSLQWVRCSCSRALQTAPHGSRVC